MSRSSDWNREQRGEARRAQWEQESRPHPVGCTCTPCARLQASERDR